MIAFDGRRDEVLVPNCVAQPRIAAYSSSADKNAVPNRIIEGQNTRLNRTVHAIAYDEIHDEIVVQSNSGSGVLTFRGAAVGDEAPIRIIQGQTLLRIRSRCSSTRCTTRSTSSHGHRRHAARVRPHGAGRRGAQARAQSPGAIGGVGDVVR